MPRHEPLGRPAPGEVLEDATIKLRRDASGKLVLGGERKPTTATTEAKPEPRDAPDPRTNNSRLIPPYGAGV